VTDRIELRGLRAMGVHGAFPEERRQAQPFEIDVDVEADLATAGRSDQLGDTVDYGAVAAAVERAVGGDSCHLLEALAERVAREVTAIDGRIRGVTVNVRKLRPPVPLDLASAGVRITRP
jgi:7,8-dihydroneopterin aldolase/epimerase/oxygenase